MIKCDKCGKEMNVTEIRSISVTYGDIYVEYTTTVDLCDECYEEFMRTYLHEES